MGRTGKRGLKKSEKCGLGAAGVLFSSCVKGGGALVEGGGKNTSPTGQQITMDDVPLMDGADVSPAKDGRRQLLTWSRRDLVEKNSRKLKNIFTPRSSCHSDWPTTGNSGNP